ncbi:hypothetical protein BDBG_18009, partial [Blastomyces gilchristii SLH14081]
SSYINRFIFTDNCDLNVELLIKNLRDIIMKKLSILYVIRSFISLSALSVSFSVTFSQSFTSVSVSDSLTLTISVSVALTFTTSTFSASVISTFIISSLHFKKILYRLNKSYFLRIISLLNSVEIIKDICVFRNRNTDIILFYICRYEAHTSYLRYYHENELFTH